MKGEGEYKMKNVHMIFSAKPKDIFEFGLCIKRVKLKNDFEQF